MRARVDRLRRMARYAAPEDTSPEPESIGPEGEEPAERRADAPPAAAPAAVNVLAEDTWDLFRVLLR